MRSWMLALSMVIGLGVVAGPRSMTVLGQEKEGDDSTGPYSVVAKWPLPRTDTYTRFGVSAQMPDVEPKIRPGFASLDGSGHFATTL